MMGGDWEEAMPTKGELGAGYLAGVGLALLASLLGYVWYTRESTLMIGVGVSMAGALFVTILYVSYLFLDIDLAEYFVWNVAKWASMGLGTAATLSLFIGFGRVYFPASTLVPSLLVVTIATGGIIGTLLGVVTGLREQHLEMREVTQRNTVMNRVLRHNIKNSMNVIQGHASLLAITADDRDSEQSITAIKQAADEVVRLSDAARQIDDLATTPIRHGPVDVVQLVESYLETARGTFPSAEISADLAPSAEAQVGPIVRSAVMNLVENAIEHNDRDPVIHVSVDLEESETDPRVVIRVVDNGPGIPDSEREIIFEDREQAMAHGNGLGLWLVKWIADRYDGGLTFEENDPRGTIVTLALPAADPDAEREMATPPVPSVPLGDIRS